jgi:hypothetical protein
MEFEHEGDSYLLTGFYEEADGSINIAKTLGKYAKEVTYFHERQHRKCHQEKCKCWKKGTNYLAEYHAYRAELRDVAKRKNRRLAGAYLQQIEESQRIHATDPKFYSDNVKALNRVMRTAAFRDFLQWYDKWPLTAQGE